MVLPSEISPLLYISWTWWMSYPLSFPYTTRRTKSQQYDTYRDRKGSWTRRSCDVSGVCIHRGGVLRGEGGPRPSASSEYSNFTDGRGHAEVLRQSRLSDRNMCESISIHPRTTKVIVTMMDLSIERMIATAITSPSLLTTTPTPTRSLGGRLVSIHTCQCMR